MNQTEPSRIRFYHQMAVGPVESVERFVNELFNLHISGGSAVDKRRTVLHYLNEARSYIQSFYSSNRGRISHTEYEAKMGIIQLGIEDALDSRMYRI